MPKWSSLGGNVGKDVMKNLGIISFNLVVIKNILKTVVLNNAPRDIWHFWETFWLSQLSVAGGVQLH